MILTPGQLNRRAELYHQLGATVAAGVPLIQALEMASNNPAVRGQRRTILTLIQYLKTGMTFADSMAKVQGWMSEFDIALLTAGEQSGRLDECFKVLSSHYGTRASIIRETISGMMTTLLTLHVFLLIFPLELLTGGALGIINGNLSEALPFLFEKLLVFGTLYSLVFIFLFASQGQRGEAWRSFVESVTRWVPILGRARRFLSLARLSGALEACTAAGVPVIKGWELAASASASPRLKREVFAWKRPIESGVTPAELVNRSDYFPEMFANLYDTAEHTGKIEETLGRLAVYYQEEGYRALRMFTRILNGMIYGGVALMVAITVVRFYQGYFKSITGSF